MTRCSDGSYGHHLVEQWGTHAFHAVQRVFAVKSICLGANLKRLGTTPLQELRKKEATMWSVEKAQLGHEKAENHLRVLQLSRNIKGMSLWVYLFVSNYSACTTTAGFGAADHQGCGPFWLFDVNWPWTLWQIVKRLGHTRSHENMRNITVKKSSMSIAHDIFSPNSLFFRQGSCFLESLFSGHKTAQEHHRLRVWLGSIESCTGRGWFRSLLAA